MDEAFVPSSGRILYVTPHTNTLIKNAKDLQRMLGATESVIKRSINRVDELTIEVVPSKLMKRYTILPSAQSLRRPPRKSI